MTIEIPQEIEKAAGGWGRMPQYGAHRVRLWGILPQSPVVTIRPILMRNHPAVGLVSSSKT